MPWLLHTVTALREYRFPSDLQLVKPLTGSLVIWWVTTNEAGFLYVFPFFSLRC